MNQNFLHNAEYVYSSLHKWGLKRYSCRVQYYTEEPLSDLDFVICSLLATTEDGAYDKRSLGIMLVSVWQTTNRRLIMTNLK